MPKKTPSRSTKRRVVPSPKVPIGMRAIFAALAPQDLDQAAVTWNTAQAFPFAQRIMALASSGADDASINEQLKRATRAVFDGTDDDASTDPSLAMVAGFYVGLATSWLLMTSINGGAR